MILENFKRETSSILRVLMAFIFISAGIFRIFNPELAATELENLNLPHFFTWFLIVLETIGGFYLLLKGKYWHFVAKIFIVFLIFALGLALIVNFKEILNNASELFVFDLTPTDFFMHFVFLLILIFLIFPKRAS